MRTATALLGGLSLILAGLLGPATPAAAAPGSASAATTATVFPDSVSADSVRASWSKSFASLEKQLPGTAGVSVVGVGHAGSVTVGSWRSGVAWSTSKVPVSVAALRRSPSASTKRLVKRAITVSDNAAAEKLWSRLGRPKTAAARTQKVIRDAGDKHTKVQSKRVRAGFTAFGQTRWTTTNQARFGAGLACRAEAKPVLRLMGQITTSQRWGLGHVRGARFKGGWGPVGKGYLVRQLGVVVLPDGRTYGVSIAVWSPKGFSRATRDLTRVANWLEKRIGQVPARAC